MSWDGGWTIRPTGGKSRFGSGTKMAQGRIGKVQLCILKTSKSELEAENWR